jgi:hypothetical protein
MALHKENVFIDLSGWSPRYFPKQVIQYATPSSGRRCCSARTIRSSRRQMDGGRRQGGFRDSVMPASSEQRRQVLKLG